MNVFLLIKPVFCEIPFFEKSAFGNGLLILKYNSFKIYLFLKGSGGSTGRVNFGNYYFYDSFSYETINNYIKNIFI